jgi:GntR family transcriptional regulator/MocR family aminotransferase
MKVQSMPSSPTSPIPVAPESLAPEAPRARQKPLAPEKPFALRDLPLDGEGPLYDQIYRALRAAILDGRVSPGTRLPTTRALAQELGISRNTVVSAFEPLRAEGYVATRVGAGTFVARQVETGLAMARAAQADARDRATPERPLRVSRYGRSLLDAKPRKNYDAMLSRGDIRIDFRPCVPDLERLSDESWRRALTRTANYLPSEAFDYADPSGVQALRESIASYLGRARGIRCEADEIVIVGGVAQAVDLATRLFVDPGDAVLIENPHYLGARRALGAAGARLIATDVDAEGIDLSGLSAADRRAARLAYVTPSHQFPTGAVMSLTRRLELLRWAEESNAFIVEDDYDSEFRYSGRAIEALKSLDQDGRVFYVGTFSKTLLPALRIAYLVLPPRLVELFRSAKFLSDWAAPSFEQHALVRFLESGDFERHLRRARTLYAESRAALVEAIDRELTEFEPVYRDSHAGLHLLVRFQALSARQAGRLVHAGFERGLGLYPADPCYDGGTPKELELILGFARLEPAAIREGAVELRKLLWDHRRQTTAD